MKKEYPDLKLEDLQNSYSKAKEFYNFISDKIGNILCKDPHNLRGKDYIYFFERSGQLEFYERTFKTKNKERLAGSLEVDPSKEFAIVGINASMNDGRKIFTELHEIVHWIHDVPKGYDGQSFSDVLKNAKYSQIEQHRESFVNFVAANMQIPTDSMAYMLATGKSLKSDFSNEFNSSYSANFRRVLDYLIFELKFSEKKAYSLTADYSNNPFSSKLYHVLSRCFDNEDIYEMKKNENIIIFSEIPRIQLNYN